MDKDNELGELIRERFASLPAVVQQAIVSADISKRLQELAKKHNLHLDQWEALENEVQLTLLGVKTSEKLSENIQSEIGVDVQTAIALATDISQIVFEPIRQELERQLEHPAAVAEKTTGVEDMRTQVLTDAAHDVSTAAAQSAPAAPAVASAPAIAPGTPPAPPVTAQVERAPVSSTYAPAAPSHERKTIEGDPYREQLE